MKTFKIIIAGLFFLFLSLGVVAQGDPPNPPGDHGSGDDQGPGGDASSSSGMLLLLVLTAAYGGKKIYDLNKKKATVSD